MPQVTLTLKTDEGLARPAEMRRALQALVDAGLLPSTGLKMTFTVFTDRDAADLEAALTLALEDRAWVIDAEVEIKTKRGVDRKVVEKAPEPTAIDKYLAELDRQEAAP